MASKVTNVRRANEPLSLEDGVFYGYWSGHTVRWLTPKGGFFGEVSDGIRGIDIPCIVTVSGGVPTVVIAGEITEA